MLAGSLICISLVAEDGSDCINQTTPNTSSISQSTTRVSTQY
jgi:hypothetical protein